MNLFKWWVRRRIIKKIGEASKYSFNNFSIFIDRVVFSKEQDHSDLRKKMGVEFGVYNTRAILQIIKEMKYEEVKILWDIYKKIYVNLSHFSLHSKDVRECVRKTIADLLVLASQRIASESKRNVESIMSSLMPKEEQEVVVGKEVVKKPQFKYLETQGLLNIIDDILSKNSAYKAKHNTLTTLITDTENIVDMNQRRKAVELLLNKTKEHEAHYVNAPVSDRDQIILNVIEERVSRL